MNEIITICFFKHLASSAHSHQRPGICGQYFFFTICHSSVLAVEENLPAASMRMPFASMHFEVILIDSLCEEALLATSVRSMRKGWGKEQHCNVVCQMVFRCRCQIGVRGTQNFQITMIVRPLMSTSRACLFSYARNFDRIEPIVTLDNVL